MDSYQQRVGQRLKALRNQHSYTAEQCVAWLAERGHDISRQTWYYWEAGKYGLPWDVVPLIAWIFELDDAKEWLP